MSVNISKHFDGWFGAILAELEDKRVDGVELHRKEMALRLCCSKDTVGNYIERVTLPNAEVIALFMANFPRAATQMAIDYLDGLRREPESSGNPLRELPALASRLAVVVDETIRAHPDGYDSDEKTRIRAGLAGLRSQADALDASLDNPHSGPRMRTA